MRDGNLTGQASEEAWMGTAGARVREALDRQGPAIPDAVFAAIHVAAAGHAAQRRSPWVRWWGLWRNVVVGTGGAAVAALVVLVLALPDRGPSSDHSGDPHVDDLPASTLALMAMAEAGDALVEDDRPDLEVLSEYLLRMQERPGRFEEVHTLFAAGW